MGLFDKRGKTTKKDSCWKCGAILEEGSAFCDQCGSSVANTYDKGYVSPLETANVSLEGKKECPRCGYANESESLFCSECGYRYESALDRCSVCGAILDETDDFCSVCGTANSLKKHEKSNNHGAVTTEKTDSVYSSVSKFNFDKEATGSSSIHKVISDEITDNERAAAVRNFHKPPVL